MGSADQRQAEAPQCLTTAQQLTRRYVVDQLRPDVSIASRTRMTVSADGMAVSTASSVRSAWTQSDSRRRFCREQTASRNIRLHSISSRLPGPDRRCETVREKTTCARSSTDRTRREFFDSVVTRSAAAPSAASA